MCYIHHMNVDYINPFIMSSLKVFKTLAHLESKPGTPRISNSLKHTGYVNGYIGLEGHGISGYLMITFSICFLQQIFKTLFGSKKKPSEADLFDAAGELTNMISGGAKAELSKQGFFFDMAVPLLSQSLPEIPEHLKQTPTILVPFDTKASDYTIQASILKIEEDFEEETLPEVPPPAGMISVAQFSERTGMGIIKVRRFLKTGFLEGKKVSQTQWHIPEKELRKVQVINTPKKVHTSEEGFDDTYVSISEFSDLSRLTPAKIKGFLRTGFLKGNQDENNIWHIKRHLVSKFR